MYSLPTCPYKILLCTLQVMMDIVYGSLRNAGCAEGGTLVCLQDLRFSPHQQTCAGTGGGLLSALRLWAANMWKVPHLTSGQGQKAQTYFKLCIEFTSSCVCKVRIGSGEMSQQEKALATKPDDLRLIP